MSTFFTKAWCKLPEVPVGALGPECTNAYWKLSVCTFSCKPGYQRIANGVYDVRCLHFGSWDSRASGCESQFTGRIRRLFSTKILYAIQNATDYTLRKIIAHKMCAINDLMFVCVIYYS